MRNVNHALKLISLVTASDFFQLEIVTNFVYMYCDKTRKIFQSSNNWKKSI